MMTPIKTTKALQNNKLSEQVVLINKPVFPHFEDYFTLCLMTKFALLLLALSLLSACTTNNKDISAQIEAQFIGSNTEPINLAVLGPDTWERVCVLPPYTLNKQAEKILGFKWNSERQTSIAGSDGINVLVFVQGDEVVAFTEHPRNKGDFSRMNPRCLERKLATVVRLNDPDPRNGGWVFLVADQ